MDLAAIEAECIASIPKAQAEEWTMSKPRDWTPATRELPPEGVEVEVMAPSGHVQHLVRDGRLWWFVDRSMYVYYTPQFWREVDK